MSIAKSAVSEEENISVVHLVKEVEKAALEHWRLIIVCLICGAISGAVVRAIVLLGQTTRDAWPRAIGLGALAGVLAAVEQCHPAY
jgi:hypothetical protein